MIRVFAALIHHGQFERREGVPKRAESLMEAGARAAERVRHAAAQLGVLPLEKAPGLSMEYAEPLIVERRFDGCWSHVTGHWKSRFQIARGSD
jgi:hypothetical protein